MYTNIFINNFILKNHEKFYNSQPYTILIQRISTTTFRERSPTFHIFKKYVLCWHQNIQQFTVQTYDTNVGKDSKFKQRYEDT